MTLSHVVYGLPSGLFDRGFVLSDQSQLLISKIDLTPLRISSRTSTTSLEQVLDSNAHGDLSWPTVNSFYVFDC